MVSVAQERFRLGAVIGRSFSILVGNIVPFGLLYLAVNASSSIYALTLAGTGSADEAPGMAFLNLAEALLGLVAGAAVTYATVQELRGRRVAFSEFFRRGLSQAGAAIRVALLSGILLILAFIALVIPGLILYTMWWVAIPVAVIERPGAMASLRRSADLTAGNRWRVFGLILCFFFAAGVGGGLFVVAADDGLRYAVGVDQTGIDLASTIVTWLWAALIMAGQAVLTAVSYYHLRVAKEGVGIDDIAAVFD